MRNSIFFLLLLVPVLALSGQEAYFTQGILSDDSRDDVFRSKWYSKHLKALEEPSLLQMATNPSSESYRFVWLRTFHHPVIVRVDVRADGIGELTSKVSNGAGGYEPGKLIENTSRPLTRQQTEGFLATIKKAQFWELPTHETPATVGCDGSQWIIEGVKNGKYHVVDRWTPSNGAVHELGLTFAIGLAQMKIPKGEIY